MENSVDPDQTTLLEQSDKNIHCLLRHICHKYLEFLRYCACGSCGRFSSSCSNRFEHHLNFQYSDATYYGADQG